MKGRLTRFVGNEKDSKRVTPEDLKKIFDSQLSQQSQLWGFVFGAIFGGLLTTLLTYGIDVLKAFNPITQPAGEATAILGVAAGIVLGMVFTFTAMTNLTLRFKLRLLKDYSEAREILERRRSKTAD
jgi:hypothetical protein